MGTERVISRLGRSGAVLLLAGLLAGAASEFYNIAYGTGGLFGGFSIKWLLAELLFILFCLIALVLAGLALWQPGRLRAVSDALVRTRASLKTVRWVIAAAVLLFPIWLLQNSPWGVVFSKIYIRLSIWLATVLVLAYLVSRDSQKLATSSSALAAILMTGALFIAVLPFGQVTAYPFALGWSEGNRLWDFSLAFASHLYQYAPSDPPAAYLEPGRQLVGAIPFLFPNISIVTERMWLAMLDVLPYLILGLLAFRPSNRLRQFPWIPAGIWGFMFLSQGPIHTPLVICAILVAIAWGQPIWLAAPLLFASGYFAEISRFTWIFAPAIWIVMLEFGSATVNGNRMPRRAWVRAATLGIAGLLGSLALPKVLDVLHISLGIRSSATGAAIGGVSVSTVTSAASKQALLWYRLLPNATYGSGILVGLLIAAGPLAALLLYRAAKAWKLNVWQRMAIILPLLAFLGVGMVISTKIGGGGDLHNLDMFLIGLLFAAALAWKAGGSDWIASISNSPLWARGLLALALALPAFQPLMALRPLSFAGDENWLVVLTDASRPKDLGSLPSSDSAAADLKKLQADIKAAQSQGPVLFMDQRQLLTFGYVTDVELVPEFEKKQMMDEALSANESYFQPFYEDLAAHKFSMIISDPLRTPIKDSEYGFGEENNAWVKWITKPVLCYYEEKDTLTNVRVELLVPRPAPNDCTSVLP